MAMTRKYEGVKLVKKTFYLEPDDLKVFEDYAKKENKKTSAMIRLVMSKYAVMWKKVV